MSLKHSYATRKKCPNYLPISAENPSGRCGCAKGDLEQEIHHKKLALEGIKQQVITQQTAIQKLEFLLARAEE